MKRNLTSLGVFLLIITVIFTSCSREHGLALVKRNNANLNEYAKSGIEHKSLISDQAPVKTVSKTNEIKLPESIMVITPKFNESRNQDKQINNLALNNIKPESVKLSSVNSNSTDKNQLFESFITINSKAADDNFYKSSGGGSDDKVLYVIICIFIPFLAVALFQNSITSDFWIDLILTLLFYLPGLIYGLWVILR